MSAIFRSAAMTLLSKTLQTLLGKYLSDVDVEGVALPSLYNSDGHSGWGVRLSNVKLREGAKLMDLPGTKRRKRKKNKRQQNRRRKNKDKSSQQNESQENQKENVDMETNERLITAGPPTNGMMRAAEKQESSVMNDALLPPSTNTTRNNSESSSYEQNNSLLGTMPQQQQQQQQQQQPLQSNGCYKEEEEEDLDIIAARAAAQVAQAAAANSGSYERRSWFSYFYGGPIEQTTTTTTLALPETQLSSEVDKEASVSLVGEPSTTTATTSLAADGEEASAAENTKDPSQAQSSSSDNEPSDSQKQNAQLAQNNEEYGSSNESSSPTSDKEMDHKQQSAQDAPPNDESNTDAAAEDQAAAAAAAANTANSESTSTRRGWFGYLYGGKTATPASEQSQQEEKDGQPSSSSSSSPCADAEAMTSVPVAAEKEEETQATPVKDDTTSCSTREEETATKPPQAEETSDHGALDQSENEEKSNLNLNSSFSSFFLRSTSSLLVSTPKDDDKAVPASATDTLLTPRVLDNSEQDDDENEDYFEYGSDEEDEREEEAEEEEEEEDLFEEVDAPMILRLGPAGRIGTLDVRLVGKDIHVLVEDADLLIEVIRPPPKNEEEDSGGEASPDKKSKTTEKKKTPIPEPKTVGDRVMAENTIARALSAIPNLLLRDIRVRLVVRDGEQAEEEEEGANGADGEGAESLSTTPAKTTTTESTWSPEKEETQSATSGDGSSSESSETVYEVCIELLSVTADGQDFFAHFRNDDEEDSSEDGDMEVDEMDDSRNVVSTAGGDGDNQTIQENEYLTKRIRTGRGPDGGITIRVFPGGISDHFMSASRDDEWSRYRWLSFTEFCVLRCSGLDVHARIFMGTRKEIRHSSSSVSWYHAGDEYDDFSVDTMLFGVDYIAPGPQPPLPPIEEQTNLGTEEDGQLWMLPGATTYQVDSNGIQSSTVGSSFHRVARGMIPTVCRCDHLPCEYCPKCWEAVPGTTLEHKLDDSAPMGGLVLNVSMRDRFELNVDRPCLESIGLLLSLFTKQDQPNEIELNTEPAAEEGHPDSESVTCMDMSEASARSMSSRNNSARGLKTRSSSLDHGSKHLRRSSSKSGSLAGDNEKRHFRSASTTGSIVGDQEKEAVMPSDAVDPAPTEQVVDAEMDDSDVTNAFPAYLQPEKVQYVGIHLSEIVFRVHLMREKTVEDHRLSFRFWSVLVKCLTIDHQQLALPARNFQDLRCDFGHFSADEYRGVERKQLASLGLRQRVVDFDEVTVETLMTREADCMRPPWPSTAAVLLDLPPPVESLLYETRDRHAIQFRFVAIHNAGVPSDFSRSSAIVKLGATFVDIPSDIGSQISTIISEAKSSIMGPPASTGGSPGSEDAVVESKPVDSLMKYKLQLDGARVSLQKWVDVRVPLTTLVGERSSTEGLSIQTVVEHMNLKYGNTVAPTLFSDRRLSLEYLAELPEPVRLRILLFLDNLNPLARAFGIKVEENSFLLCGAINKAIVKLSRAKRRKSLTVGGEDPEGSSRRQEIMSELLKLDDDDLEDLWETHLRQQRRVARKKSNSKY